MSPWPIQIDHGEARRGERSFEYRVWSQILQRCFNPKRPEYANYGGRGITICDKWRSSYSAFLAEVGRAPGKGYTIERIDNNGNYEPGNVRWATRLEQCRNKRNSCILTINGVSRTLAEWVEITGISRGTITNRRKRGWSLERCISPVTRWGKLLFVNGVGRTVPEWAQRLGVRNEVIWNRLKIGWTPEAAVSTPLLSSSVVGYIGGKARQACRYE